MARRRYRYRKNRGLIELSATSDWRFGAALASACVVGAVVIIPMFFAGNTVLHGLVDVFTMFAWLMAVVFGVIALFRFIKQRSDATSTKRRPSRRSDARNTVKTPPTLAVSRDPSGPVSQFAAADAFTDGLPRIPRSNTATIAPSINPSVPERPDAWSLDVLDRIEWKRFEDLCCEFYREKGIHAETTRLGADGGIDIHLFQNKADLTQVTAIVQCKALSKKVGVAPVRELRGVMAHEKVEKAFFMAPNGFTDDAVVFAEANRIILLDGKLFLAMLQHLPEASAKRLLDFATEGDWTIPTCPSCGAKMVHRDSKWGSFWGCSTYPRCNEKLHMRRAGYAA